MTEILTNTGEVTLTNCITVIDANTGHKRETRNILNWNIYTYMHSILGITYSLAPRACRSFTMCTLVKGKVSASNPIHSSSNSAKLMSAGCPLCEDVKKTPVLVTYTVQAP